MTIYFTTAMYIREQRIWVVYNHLRNLPEDMYYTPTYPKNLEELKGLLLVTGQDEGSTLKKLPHSAMSSAGALEDTMTLLQSAQLLLHAGTNEYKAIAYSRKVGNNVHFESRSAAQWILDNPTLIDL